MATFTFDSTSVEQIAPRTFAPLPAGDYLMIVTASDIKPTKSGNGHYLELQMQVVDGPSSGRRHWERLNISNSNKKAEDIAKSALATLCTALGLPGIEKDSDELHDRPFVAVVDIDRKEPDRNRIVTYKPAGTAQAPSKPAPAPAGKPARPWG
jgi:hypothetical protein